MIDRKLTYAVVGASFDHKKYGHKVFTDLVEGGYKVVPINNKGGVLYDHNVYKNLTGYPGQIDVAIFVVPPDASLKVLEDVKEKEIKQVWFQPGSESEAAISFCNQNKIENFSGICIMIERKNNPS